MHTHPSDPHDRENRVRLDDVFVELSTDSPDEAFEADVLNIGPGGLAVRSPLLPDVGSKLRCSFASPLDGSAIHAQCEVVWASDQGPNLGEFGLRFERLSGESAESLRRIVENEDRLLSAAEASDLGWAAPPVVEPAILGLSLDGVASELVVEAVHDSMDVLVAEQELPFLRIGTGVTTENGRRGVLQSVELRVDDELPRLVLTIVYDGDEQVEDSSEADAMRGPAKVLALADDESQPESDDVDELGESDEASASRDDSDDSDDSLDGFLAGDHDTIPDAKADPAYRDESRGESHQASPPVRTPTSRVRAVGEPVLAKASGVASAVKDATSDRIATAIPAVRDGIDRARESATAVAGAVGTNVVEGTRASLARLARFASLVMEKTRSEQPVAADRPRRVQRRPDEAAAPAKVAETTKWKGRHILVGALALVVLALAVQGVWNAPDRAGEPATPSVDTVDVSSGTVEPSVTPVAPTADVAPAEVAPAAVPTVSTPSYAAGPMPTPTYPSVGGNAPASASAMQAPSVQPVASAPAVRNFGSASVPGGMPFELMMNMPIESISGSATADGFVVHIVRSTSATRAGPIADQHPDVEHASVTNAGSDSDLRIRFKPGRHPAYRVEANGNRLRILIGRAAS